ncbi:MAG: hypothetical protein ABI878_10300 [Acidobacteriota bacterium]
MERQPSPDLWIEISGEEGQPVRVDLGKDAKLALERRWQTTLVSCQNRNESGNYDSRIAADKDYANAAAIAIQHLTQIDLISRDGKRKITSEEAGQLTALTAQFAIERFRELSEIEHFRHPSKIVIANFIGRRYRNEPPSFGF